MDARKIWVLDRVTESIQVPPEAWETFWAEGGGEYIDAFLEGSLNGQPALHFWQETVVDSENTKDSDREAVKNPPASGTPGRESALLDLGDTSLTLPGALSAEGGGISPGDAATLSGERVNQPALSPRGTAADAPNPLVSRGSTGDAASLGSALGPGVDGTDTAVKPAGTYGDSESSLGGNNGGRVWDGEVEIHVGEGERKEVSKRMRLRVLAGALTVREGLGKVVYLLRAGDEPLGSVEEMEERVEWGLLPQGPSLGELELVLNSVFIPMLSKHSGKQQQEMGAWAGVRPATPGRMADLIGSLHKFIGQVSYTRHQLYGNCETQLALPNVAMADLEDVAARDEDVMSQLEHTIADWTRTLQAAVQKAGQEHPQGTGPLAELDFWRHRSTVLTGLYEQLNLPRVQRISAIVQKASLDHDLVAGFANQQAELKKLMEEAHDNVSSLSTLERHFKTIASGPLEAIGDALPGLMSALRLVWVLSRHYKDDGRMGGLLKRIAVQIADRVEEVIKPQALFSMPAPEALQLVGTAKHVLLQWQQQYNKVREDIEASNRDARWEFNRGVLFERTGAMADVCGDLADMVETLDSYHQFLGPELKSVTGDPQAIDMVLAGLTDMVKLVEDIDFNIFDKAASTRWLLLKSSWNLANEDMKAATHDLIDTCFRKLRSAEAALGLLDSFRRMQARGAVQQQMASKLYDILAQFSREMEATSSLFRSLKEHPPVTRNQPAVAGAIAWSRSLFARCKQTMTRLQAVEPALLSDPEGQRVSNQYRALGRLMLNYEKDLFAAWKESAPAGALLHLRAPILRQEPEGGRISVNFAPELEAVMREGRGLDRLGFAVPEAAASVALQQPQLTQAVEGLTALLARYEQATEQLTAIERQLLGTRLLSLRKALDPGFSPLNWTSLGIPEFISSAGKAIGEFQALVSEVRKATAIAEKAIASISAAKLYVEPDPSSSEGIPDLQELADGLERRRVEGLEELAKKYRSMTPVIIKVEALVLGTSTGKSQALASYYAYWEGRVHNALTTMVLRGLKTLHRTLNGRRRVSAQEAVPRGPLFRVAMHLANPEVVVQPSAHDIKKMINRLAKGIVESGKPFVRWMDGTCLEAPEIPGPTKDDEPFVHSFYLDLRQNSSIVRMMMAVSHSVHKVVYGLTRYVDSWKQHSGLWKTDKNNVIDKFRAKLPSHAEYEEKLAKYSKLADEMWEAAADVNLDFISVNARPLGSALRDEALSWVRGLSAAMQTTDKHALQELLGRLASLRTALKVEPTSLEALKGVLSTIANIREASLPMELQYTDLEERFRTRTLYAAEDEKEELEREYAEACLLREACQALQDEADEVDQDLAEPKEAFSETTRKEVEEFQVSSSAFLQRLQASGPGRVADIGLAAGLQLLQSFQEEAAARSRQREELQLAERLFGMDQTSFPHQHEAEAALRQLAQVYAVYAEHTEMLRQQSAVLWADLDVKKLAAMSEETAKKLRGLKHLSGLPVYSLVAAEISGFQVGLPLMRDLKNDAMRRRHWDRLVKATGQQCDLDPKTFTLGSLFAMNLHQYASEVGAICLAAVKELTIEIELKKMADVWRDARFEIHRYTRGGTAERGLILKGTDDITMMLEDMSMNLASMLSSRYVRPLLDEVRRWEARLGLIGEALAAWMAVQRKWIYLESIFASDDIRHQLPHEAKRFETIDRAWKKLMAETARAPLVLDACSVEGRVPLLQGLADQLEACQKSLSDYLDSKRCVFPRFYFISDEELLSVLAAGDPAAVQEHLLKLFDNCAALNFGPGHSTVTGLTSSEGETFNFPKPMPVEGPVEVWMSAVEREMRNSLRVITKRGVDTYNTCSRPEWIEGSLGMVTVLGSAVAWTADTEEAFRSASAGDSDAMEDLERKLNSQLHELTALVRKDLTNHMRKKVNTLIITDVHARDIVGGLRNAAVKDAGDFQWESQLRFYWDAAEDDVLIRQCTGLFRYGYEYLGLSGRLVITALTDRCYMTLTTALSFQLGGAPAGPAGTGKTETVKDLAKSLGLLCVVFNCGEGLDVRAMGAAFSGLVQSGAWGCFDEFNRIEAEVLSVVSAQIRCIQEALRAGPPRFLFEGKEIGLDRRTGIMITMNPGYAGRTELPDNLKALFRPVSMVVPDLEQICEIMLFSEGFDTAKALAKKMTVLYKLAKEQLSRQFHYDFGLRALKSVLVMAGGLKRASPDVDEAGVLMRTLRDMNLPKFVYDDVPLFLGLLADLFPGMDCPRVRDEKLVAAVEAVLAGEGLQLLRQPGDQVDKVLQLSEVLAARHTAMLVGQTSGGKSVVLQTLAKAQTHMGLRTTLHILNPKAITVPELYGVLDADTRDWTDGLLSNIFREVNKPLVGNKEEAKYIVFDGDVDAVWVENMNSCMDDNKLLTLPNGERIRLQAHCRLLFEVADLQYASPATVSRCGMVFIDPRNLGFQPSIATWLSTRSNPAEKEMLATLFTKYATPAILFVTEGVTGQQIGKPLLQSVRRTPLNMVSQLCTLLEGLLRDTGQHPDPRVVEATFIFCLVWSVGATLVQEPSAPERDRLDAFLRKRIGLPSVDSDTVVAGQLPSRSLYDYCFVLEDASWKAWKMFAKGYEPPADGLFASILVPTADVVRTSWLLRATVGGGRSCLLVGGPGTGKSMTLGGFLTGLDPTTHCQLEMSLSSRSTSADVQHAIEVVVEKRTKDVYGPPMGKRLALCVDDLNMPKMDKYGTQQPLALLRLFLDRQGFYDRGKELNWKTVKDVLTLAAMGPPGGARNPIDPRLASLFLVFEVQAPTSANLRTIFSSILKQHALGLSPEIQGVCEGLTDATLEIFNYVLEKLLPTPSRFHYIFTPRDLSRITEGLTLARPQAITTNVQFLRLWRNECLRVLHDKLICVEDKMVVANKVNEVLETRYGGLAAEAVREPLLFGDIPLPGVAVGERAYQEVGSFETLKRTFEELLADLNSRMKPMQLVFFNDALEHLLRIIRILRLPQGHALLVGVGGSGKQSLAKLAAFVAGCDVFEITRTRKYDETAFREDLKILFNLVAVDNKKVVFLFTDAHVVDEGFLELINNILTLGIVPTLFREEEKETLRSAVRDEVVAAGGMDTKEACWLRVVQRCRANLHVVLAMSPVGETLQRRCRDFPGFVSNTVIDWFDPWPEVALESVAAAFLKEEIDLLPEIQAKVASAMVVVHQSARAASRRYADVMRRYNHVTPKSYLDLVAGYRRILGEQRQRCFELAARLDGGLQKLIQAATDVDAMQAELTEARVVVQAATRECDELLIVIGTNTAEVETKQTAALSKEADLKVESDNITVEKAEAETALAAAIPALEEAAAALNDLKKDDITEIRSFAKPHILVQKVCECVVILRQLKEVSWAGAKAMMVDTNFLRTLVDFDKDSLTEKQVKSVKEYMKDPKFTVTELRSISTAGAGLLKWVSAMVNYYGVAHDVEPKRRKVADSERSMRQSQRDLGVIKAEVVALTEQLRQLREQFERKTGEALELRQRADLMERRLAAASRLLEGLGSERVRWTADFQALEGRKERLLGDSLLAAGFMSYLGAFTADFRHDLLEKIWMPDISGRSLPFSPSFRLQGLLSDEAEIGQWATEGLPPDDFSVQNGLLTLRATRFPLCIDPQAQAVHWIKRREGRQLDGRTKTLNDSDFLKQLELAIQYGAPFLLEGLDEYLDPILDPVLERSLITLTGGRKAVRLGDKEVDWDDTFRLYMTTKLPNPRFGPEIFGKALVINYSVTQEGLAEQLLTVVVAHERPDLEEARISLIQRMANDRQLLQKLEDTLLHELSHASGNILDNQDLIHTLEETKGKAVEIGERLKEAEKTKAEMEEARGRYGPAAERGALLFFAVASLAFISNMYETSLAAFLGVFDKALATSHRDAALEKRLRHIVDALTYDVFCYTCVGLFERHKLLFSFHVATRIGLAGGLLDQQLLDFFLKGSQSLKASARPKPHAWLFTQGWEDALRLAQIASERTDSASAELLARLPDSLVSHADAWKAYYELEMPEEAPLPNGLSERLSAFEHLLVLRCVRPDRVALRMMRYVASVLGERYVQPPSLEYSAVYAQSTEHTPIVFILSPGADPAFDIFRLGEEMGYKAGVKLKHLALGQGMGPRAAELMEAAAARGLWLLLQNCHLLPKWLKTMEKILDKIDRPHRDFRLWVTTEPTDAFPLAILQRSLKIVTEPPAGLRRNMKGNYSKLSDTALSECSHEAFRPLVLTLAFFHAVVQERQRYGKLGWNVRYDFNETDFRISMALISKYLNKASEQQGGATPWATLRFLIGEAMYGGRVSDTFDRRVLATYLKKYLNEAVLEPSFTFYSSGTVIYSIPSTRDWAGYNMAIDALPGVQTPEVYGLNPNADISHYATKTRALWADLVELQPRAGSGSAGVSHEGYVTSLAQDLAAKLPPEFDLPAIRNSIGSPLPTQAFLLQELERFNQVVFSMRASLTELQRALAGEVGFSAALEELSAALSRGHVPPAWACLNPPTQKPLGPWMAWFARRYAQYVAWVQDGEPAVMWLGGLHTPETYLAALVQQACRDKGLPLDMSTTYTKVTSVTNAADISEKPRHGCYLTGTYLEGASWSVENGCLEPQKPKVLVEEMPIIQIIPCEASQAEISNTLPTPVYVTQARRDAMGTGLVFEANLAITLDPGCWVLQGVALFLNVDH